MRALFRWLDSLLLACVQHECRGPELARPAIVFAPHPDDETLGCGGTILRKRAAGADVSLVFMTDGAQSHARLIAPAEMRTFRAAEAVAAARALGVERERVHLLDFPDSRLAEHREEGVRRVADLLGQLRPEDIYVPYHLDGPADHLATTEIVQEAMRVSGRPATVWEYPIWFWHHWPWTRLPGPWRALPHCVKEGLSCTRRLLRDFHWYVRIDGVLERKRAALAEHRSQVECLVPGPDWLALGDIAGGDFLACFFRQREIFYRHAPDITIGTPHPLAPAAEERG